MVHLLNVNDIGHMLAHYLQLEKNTLHVYVTDMGLTKLKVNLSAMSNVAVVGTPYYSAPETFHGQVGEPSDIWNCGIMLLELFGAQCTCSNIWHHIDLIDKMMQKELPTRIIHLAPHWRELCTLCLNHDSSKGKYTRNFTSYQAQLLLSNL